MMAIGQDKAKRLGLLITLHGLLQIQQSSTKRFILRCYYLRLLNEEYSRNRKSLYNSYNTLKPGGKNFILEFKIIPPFQKIYEYYLNNIIPILGDKFANNKSVPIFNRKHRDF